MISILQATVRQITRVVLLGGVGFSLFFGTLMIPVGTVHAQCAVNPGRAIIPKPGGLPEFGCTGKTGIAQTILRIVFATLAIISVLFIAIGGLRYVISGGDSNAIASAKKTILYAVIGLALGLSVFFIVEIIFGRLFT